MQDERFDALNVVVGSNYHLKITCAVVTDFAHITRETLFECDRIRINLEIYRDPSLLWMHFRSHEVPQSGEGEVVFERLQLHIIPQGQRIRS